MNMKKWCGILILFGTVVLLNACAATPTPAPLLTETAVPTATWTLTPLPTETATLLPSATPTKIPTSTPRPRATATRRRIPAATLTPSPTAGPSPTPSAAQICDSLAKRSNGIFVVYIHPVPDLVWDTIPRQFQVGLCDTIPLPSTPQGKYKIVLNFPNSQHGSTESAPAPATLKPGLNEVSVGPWIPGFENHMAACAMRAVAQTQVMYNDTPDRFYHALLWADGSDRVALPIKCGGNYS
jgi:hypothetical protein